LLSTHPLAPFSPHVPAARLLLSSVKQRRKQAQKGGDAFLISKECSTSCHHDIGSTGDSEWTLDVAFCSFGHSLFEHIVLLQRWFKSQRSAAQTEGEQLPCMSKGGSNQNGKLQGGTSKRRTNKLNSKEANHIQSFFYFFYLLP
jgi:hypothetical protein